VSSLPTQVKFTGIIFLRRNFPRRTNQTNLTFHTPEPLLLITTSLLPPSTPPSLLPPQEKKVKWNFFTLIRLLDSFKINHAVEIFLEEGGR
jgi:hypothetical protein